MKEKIVYVIDKLTNKIISGPYSDVHDAGFDMQWLLKHPRENEEMLGLKITKRTH